MLNESGSRKTTSVQFYDGLGRPSLSATNSVNTSGKYVYRLQTYDHIGREYESWLPVVYYTNAFDLSSSMIENLSLSFYDDELAFQRNEYDALNRIVHIENGGEDWDNADRSIRKYYDTNSANSVIRFLAPLGVNSLQKNGYFPASTLTMEETEDENNLRTQVFKDLRGLTILERRISNSETFDTYFVYNDLGQLRYVVTPLYQTDPHKANNCYEYRYDNRGRMVKKILPQGGTIQYWYDSNNRPIYIKDAQGRHFFMLYDIHGRLVIEGSCSNVNYNAPSFTVTTQNAGDGFLGTGYAYSHPNAITHANIRKVYYYDNYNFLSSSLFSGVASSLTRTSPANATTFQTGSVLKNSNNTFIYQAIYYDDRGRAIETRQMMPEGRLLTSATSYSFTDKPDSTVTTLSDGTHQVSVTQRNEYSSGSDLLIKNSLQWGNGDITDIATYTYNDLGQLSSRQLGGNAGQVSYDYNLRGWLTHIGGSHFEEHLSYTDGPGTPQYGGSVSSLRWQVAGDNTVRGYKLSYDGLNRMTNAVYGEGTAISDNPNRYTEQITAYDKNGGILGLKRYGMLSNGGYGLIDDLSLSRIGNQVRSVTDNASPLTYTGAFNFTDNTLSVTGDEYLYYDDGSLMADANKGITQIRYDYYQNPIYISHTAGHIRESVYTPDGTRLRTVHKTAVPNISVPFGSSSYLNASNTLSITTTDYVGNFIFENDTLARYLFDGGYCSLNGYNSTPSYHFYERDHLGNNRVVVNESGAVEQITHYYPFGGIIADISTSHAFQPYKYNGKELDRMHGLDWYDYGARYYDAALGQFWRFDPLLEKYYPWNPYGYCVDNPISSIDPYGRDVYLVNDIVYSVILSTISPEDRPYVVLNKEGFIDYSIMNSHQSDSGNYNALLSLAGSDITFNVNIQEDYQFMDNDGNIKEDHLSYDAPSDPFYDTSFSSPSGLTTGESGKYGITLLPGKGTSRINSLDNSAYIYIHPSLSPMGKAEAISHELYGHGLLYHQFRNRKISRHIYNGTREDHNILLRQYIRRTRMETVSYFK